MRLPSALPAWALLLATLPSVGCTGSDDSSTPADDTQGEDTAPPGPSAAFLGLAVRLPHGALDSTCRVSFTVTASGTGDVVGEVLLSARGGEWGGISVPGGGTFVLSGNDDSCTDISDEQPFTSGAFSIADGQVGLWWWRATQEGIATLDEGDEWVRGRAVVETDPGSPADELIAFAEGVGATATEAADLPDTYELTFAEDTSVAALLTAMSDYPRYVDGEPVWRNGAPSWW